MAPECVNSAEAQIKEHKKPSESRWQRLGKISESKVRVVEIAVLSQQRTELAMIGYAAD